MACNKHGRKERATNAEHAGPMEDKKYKYPIKSPEETGGLMKDDYSEEYLRTLRPAPGKTSDGKPYDFMVQRKIRSGEWKVEVVPPEVSGLQRPLEIIRAKRQSQFITLWQNRDSDSDSQ